MTEYTPTTVGVRMAYVYIDVEEPTEVRARSFDRWLAEHDRAVAADAWDEAISATTELSSSNGYFSVIYTPKPNPYRITEED